MSSTQTEFDRPIYFFGCDMGGWHNKHKNKGDAIAVCKWINGSFHHVEATANLTFYPIDRDNPLANCIAAAIDDKAKVIISIDAALAWPICFAKLVSEASGGKHDFSFSLSSVIQNPYLYRDTERFIKHHVQKGPKERPLTAVGDKFGNNSTKAQALVVWLNRQLAGSYRPPFDSWNRDSARKADYSIIEVYPAASMKSKRFKKLTWPSHTLDMDSVGRSDIGDAKRCAMTGVCYAQEVGMLPHDDERPDVYCPDHPLVSDDIRTAIEQEGWIFCPFDN